jgi:methionyl-tRNA synthetase
VKNDKILVTSALPYANGPIHLGHLSGAYLPADIFVRYHRLKGSDIIYICGSDEHGVPITITADKENVSPQEVIDRFHNANKEAFEKFGMDFDIYSRTSLPIHHKNAQRFFKSYYHQELLNEKKSLQFYDHKAKMFLPDRYVEGTCPKCGFEEARSDECENCGALYKPTELKNPKSKITGATPKMKETSHWYFPLGDFQDRLEKYVYDSNEKFNWKENVLQYCRGWFKDQLQDRAVTRDLDWGVKVPLDDTYGKVLYVWFEAVLGYISATMDLSEKIGQPEYWKEFWQNSETRYIAFIGKDNVVFHTIIFPAMLMAWNDGNEDKFILPENVPANEFLNFEGKKFSKSRGWGIDAADFLNIFPPDPLRYTLASNLPESKDTDFYWKEFQAKNNNELADILGNFINRTFTFAQKYFNGCVPNLGRLVEIDNELLEKLKSTPLIIGNLIESYKIKDAVYEMMDLARAGNKYFNDTEPWKTVKTDLDRCSTTINLCLQTIYTIAVTFSPVIPFSTSKLFEMLNIKKADWNSASKINLPNRHQLNKPEILFDKIEDEIIAQQMSKLDKPEVNEKYDFPLISYDDFMKTDLRVAQVFQAENIKKSKKLVKIQVDMGIEKRQLVAGIGEHYKPDELIGKKVVVVANLQPVKLMGVESQGMLLAVGNDSDILKILEPDKNINLGSRVK